MGNMKRRISDDTIVMENDEEKIVVGPRPRPFKKLRTENRHLQSQNVRAGASQGNAIVISPTPSQPDKDEVDQEEDGFEEPEQAEQSAAHQDKAYQSPLRTPRQAQKAAMTFPATGTQRQHEAVGETERDGTHTRRTENPPRRHLSHVSNPGPAFPRSAYHGYKPPLHPVTEVEASLDLSAAFYAATKSAGMETPQYATFRLDQFSVYMADGRRASDLVTLEKLRKPNYPKFCFDGILSAGGKRRYVQGVPFEILAISGYGDLDFTDFAGSICIQSKLQSKGMSLGHWYQLGTPAPEYRRFHQPFLWLARFCKHFVDYLLSNQNVTLGHFRRRFLKWLVELYGRDAGFNQWLAEAKLEDFRTTITANVSFLWKECWDVDDPESGLCRHPFWGEVDPYNLTAIPAQPNKEKRTIVTPFVYQCFRRMYFGDQLEVRTITDRSALRKSDDLKMRLKLTPRQNLNKLQPMQIMTPSSMSRASSRDSFDPLSVVKGDVVCVTPDSGTKWGAGAHSWYAYVQDVRAVKGRTLLDVLWLYEPRDTTLGKAHYPFENELFLSDNCDCGKTALDLDCIVDKVNVAWSTRDPYKERGLFVRQKFRTVHEQDTYDFVALQKSDFKCQCKDKVSIFDECRSKYAVGDTVLIREWNDDLDEDRLQPAQIIEFDIETRRVVLRQFLRKSEQGDGKAKPNELVLTNVVFDKACDKVIRRCHVRFFRQDQIDRGDIVTPYDRDGTGDFFYLAREELSTRSQDNLPPINEGWDPTVHAREKMVGMSLFCGGGTFDRGLEEAGVARFKYAVDWNEHALHSHRANVRRPDKVEYFLGSVNDLLARAMAGDAKSYIAQPGAIHILAGGSPCPGFSMLQLNKLSEQSKQNASLVASIVSFVDFYVPQYFLLENVVSMTSGMGANKDENVFSQIVAALVALGYQVQQFLGDAWSHGSSQQRSRVFIVASAPGLPPLSPIPHSHGHPQMNFKRRALGLSSNGLPFGSRRDEFTAFQHVTPAQATADLPDIGDSQPQLCTQFPDHRTMSVEAATNRTRMAVVPTRPLGMGLMQAKLRGLIRGEPADFCDNANAIRSMETSRMFSRILPNGLFPTIVTKTAVGDGINGRVLHWSQNRILTVMEARRAQGYQDWEVLVGSPAQQLKIVGNSVDRKVALVLGLALRESWEQARSLSLFSPKDNNGTRVEHVAEEKDIEFLAVEASPATNTRLHNDVNSEMEIRDTEASMATDDALEGEDIQRASMPRSSPQAEPSTRSKIDELDNRTAKMLLFMPEEIDGTKNDIDGDL